MSEFTPESFEDALDRLANSDCPYEIRAFLWADNATLKAKLEAAEARLRQCEEALRSLCVLDQLAAGRPSSDAADIIVDAFRAARAALVSEEAGK